MMNCWVMISVRGKARSRFFTEKRSGKLDEPIELPPEAYQVDPLRATITYDLNLFPETPAMPSAQCRCFSPRWPNRRTPPIFAQRPGAQGNNQLVVDLKLFPPMNGAFFVKDDSGNYLKQILSVSHDASAEGPALFGVHYFYGLPDATWKPISEPTSPPCNTALRSNSTRAPTGPLRTQC
jgi:hypothetical protein